MSSCSWGWSITTIQVIPRPLVSGLRQLAWTISLKSLLSLFSIADGSQSGHTSWHGLGQRGRDHQLTGRQTQGWTARRQKNCQGEYPIVLTQYYSTAVYCLGSLSFYMSCKNENLLFFPREHYRCKGIFQQRIEPKLLIIESLYNSFLTSYVHWSVLSCFADTRF